MARINLPFDILDYNFEHCLNSSSFLFLTAAMSPANKVFECTRSRSVANKMQNNVVAKMCGKKVNKFVYIAFCDFVTIQA